MKTRLYELRKPLIQLYFPAIALLYVLIGLPNPRFVLGTIALVSLLIGLSLQLLSLYDGKIVVNTDDESEKTTVRLVFDEGTNELAVKKAVTLKVEFNQ